jgi:hypothetical protein
MTIIFILGASNDRCDVPSHAKKDMDAEAAGMEVHMPHFSSGGLRMGGILVEIPYRLQYITSLSEINRLYIYTHKHLSVFISSSP